MLLRLQMQSPLQVALDNIRENWAWCAIHEGGISPLQLDSTTHMSRILHLFSSKPMSSGLSPVRLPLRRDTELLLPPWPVHLLQQPQVCSAFEWVHWLHSIRQGLMTASPLLSWPIWESFTTSGVLHHWLLLPYPYPLLLCHPFLLHINLLPVRYQQLDCRMNILLVHETLAPFPLMVFKFPGWT